MATALETVREYTGHEYKYGFITDIEADIAAKGLNEDTVRLISAKKREPAWLLDWRLKALARWQTMEEPNWAKVELPADRLSRRSATTPRRSPTPTGRRAWTRSIRSCCAPTRSSASRCASRRCWPASRSTTCSTASRSRPPSRRSWASSASSSARSREAVQEHPGAGAPVSRHGGAAGRQFLRGAELGGVHRRLVRLRAQGRALPDGAVDLFPHQRRRDRPVRAHPDHRRRGRLCQLPRRLHRAAARREPAARRGGRADRARRRPDQVLDGAELVPGRSPRARAASTTSSPSAAPAAAATRRSPGPRSRPARRSPGNTRAASCRATTRSASSTRSR